MSVPGGQATQVAGLTAALDAEGIEQLVLAAPVAGAPPRARIGSQAHAYAVGRAGAGVHRAAAFWAAGAARELRRRAGWADLVHVHADGIVEPLALAALSPRLTGRPLVLTLHCSAQSTYVPVSRRDEAVQVVTRLAERRSIAAAARTLVLTERTRASLARQGSVERIPDAVDAQTIANRAEAGGRALRERMGLAGVPVVAYVGRLSPEKGCDLLPEVTRLLAGRNAHIVAFGGGRLEGELRERAADPALGGRLRICGPQSAAEVGALLGAADVLVLPSRHEELGSVLLEAQAAGLPVVAARAGGTSEAVDHGVTGLVVDCDAPSLARAIAQVLDDPKLRQGARRHGPERVAAGFDVPVIASRVLGTYQDVVQAVR